MAQTLAQKKAAAKNKKRSPAKPKKTPTFIYKGVDRKGNKVSGEAEGFKARVIQHEFDHLNGVLYTSRLADKRAFGFSEEIEKFWKTNDEQKSK